MEVEKWKRQNRKCGIRSVNSQVCGKHPERMGQRQGCRMLVGRLVGRYILEKSEYCACMPCPECKAGDDKIIRYGATYRKSKIGPDGKMGSRVQRYQCKECGLLSRGDTFGLPEYEGEARKEDEKNV